MDIRKSIPNTITCCSLLSGCVAVILALEGRLQGAACWIMAAAVFDFCDGFAARALRAFSPIGKDLDSLSDMVGFGVAPGMIVYRLLEDACTVMPMPFFVPYIAFVIPVFSALRLARFNIDERQTASFIGMPVPAHALFWASLGPALQELVPAGRMWVIAGIAIAAVSLSLLLVSGLPMFSLKVKSWGWKGNECRYLLIAGAAVLVACFGLSGVAGAILLYIALSFFSRGK